MDTCIFKIIRCSFAVIYMNMHIKHLLKFRGNVHKALIILNCSQSEALWKDLKYFKKLKSKIVSVFLTIITDSINTVRNLFRETKCRKMVKSSIRIKHC